MTVEATGFAGTQARISEIQARMASFVGASPQAGGVVATAAGGSSASGTKSGGFDASLGSALAASPTTAKAAKATAAAPFVWDATKPPSQVATKPGAAQALAAPAPSATPATSGTSGTGATTATSGPAATAPTTAVTATDGTSRVDALVATAKKYLGVPYKWGGTNPATGLDCSGFTQLVYKQNGIAIPRVAEDQQDAGTPVASLAQAKPGDLLFFGNPAHHVTMYLGNGKMIHAPHTGDVVKIADVYAKPSSIRRFLPASAYEPAGPTRGAGTGDARLDSIAAVAAAQSATATKAASSINGGASAAVSPAALSSALDTATRNAALSVGSSSGSASSSASGSASTTASAGWAGAPVDDTWGMASATAAKEGVNALVGDGLGGVSGSTAAVPASTASTASTAATAATAVNAAPGSALAQAPASLRGLFVAASAKYGVSADLLAAVAKQESDFTPSAVSHAGAQGLMQLMPGTARGLGVKNAFDPAQAVDGAARLLRENLKTFDGSVKLALAAYNAGAGAVRRYGGVPPYAETQNYVRKIMANLQGVSA